jgi:hypothetical protein
MSLDGAQGEAICQMTTAHAAALTPVLLAPRLTLIPPGGPEPTFGATVDRTVDEGLRWTWLLVADGFPELPVWDTRWPSEQRDIRMGRLCEAWNLRVLGTDSVLGREAIDSLISWCRPRPLEPPRDPCSSPSICRLASPTGHECR